MGIFGNDGDGTQLLPFQNGHGEQENEALAKIEKYWTEIRRGRLVPSRSEIDPRGLSNVLGHAFILERVTTRLARVRIAGAHMTDLLGMEARGLPFSASFGSASRETLADAMKAIFDEPASVRFSLASEGGTGRPELDGGMVLLPLRSDLGDISRVLGGIALSGAIGRTPRRLEITFQSRQCLTGYAAPPGETAGLKGSFHEPETRSEKRVAILVSEQNDDSCRRRTASRRRSDHLRLVVANED